MRSPTLNMDNPYSNSGPAAPLQGAHMEPTRPQGMTDSTDADGYLDGAIQQGIPSTMSNGVHHPGNHSANGTLMRPQTAVGLNSTYDELYRSQGDRNNSDRSGAAPSAPSSSRPTLMIRARSDFGPRTEIAEEQPIQQEDLGHMRHGWGEAYMSDEYMSLLRDVGFHELEIVP